MNGIRCSRLLQQLALLMLKENWFCVISIQRREPWVVDFIKLTCVWIIMTEPFSFSLTLWVIGWSKPLKFNNNNNNLIQRRNLRFFLQSPHCAMNYLQHICSSGPGAIVCKSCAAHRAFITCNMLCYVPHGTVKFDRVKIAFILGLFYWLNY